jgi:hypothetical protein
MSEKKQDSIRQEDRERMENARQEDMKDVQQQFADLFNMHQKMQIDHKKMQMMEQQRVQLEHQHQYRQAQRKREREDN